MLRSFRTSWDDKLKWLSKHIIFPLCILIFNFSLNPPVASQLPPLQREASPPQTTNNKHKNRKEKEFHEWIIVPHTEIATGLWPSQWRCGGTVIASEAKQSTNHKTAIKKQKNKKIHPSIKIQKQKTKEFYE